jgi:hypothetical protein
MPSTYEPIATTTTGGTSSVTFSSIPQTYTDLVLIVNTFEPSNYQSMSVRVNGDTSSSYSETRIIGTGSSASSGRSTNSTNWYVSQIWDGTVVRLNIMNYTNTSVYKSAVSRGDASGQWTMTSSHLWRNTSAITSLTVERGGNFTSGSTFTLYGIKAA